MSVRKAASVLVLAGWGLGGVAGAGVLEEHKKSQAFLEAAAKEEGAIKLPSGLVFKTLTAGTGESPKRTDTVRVHYRGTFIDGAEFDSSYKRGEPTEFPVTKVIRCWTEGLQRMKVGEKAQLVCPAGIAYGDRGMGGIVPPGATLVFQIELLAIVK
jgi:FKBP-type peptidyl-prolyl cis-trans isomerase FkpA